MQWERIKPMVHSIMLDTAPTNSNLVENHIDRSYYW